jgi:penicillin-binding protein 1A
VGTRGKSRPTRAERRSEGAKPKRRILRWLLGGVFLIALVCIGGFLVLYYSVDIPKANDAAVAQANVFKLSNGQVLAREGSVNRQMVDLSQVPLTVQHEFVAAENKTFYTDSGVDLKGTARALYNTVSGKGRQGGSTITQQYVKNFYLDQNPTFSRKAKELIISLKVDQDVSKSQILQGYLNTCYFGRGAYGIQAAAQAYYGIDASQLDVEQGAYLAALVQAPSEYDMAVADPTEKKLALNRWNYVLDNMVQMKWLDPATRGKAKFEQPIHPKAAAGESGQNGYIIQLAKYQLAQAGILTDDQLRAGGWTVTLTIDPSKQKDLLAAVKSQVTDHLDPKERPRDANAELGAVSVDPKTGRVVALYGGAGYLQHYVANDTRNDYQAASTFKPVELAAALQNHSVTQDGKQISADTIYSGKSGRPVVGAAVPFAPPNEDDVSYGDITVQKAMDDSVNSVFAQLAVDVGLDKVADTAISLGMPSGTAGLREGPAIALGTMGASPLTMAGIYATFDDHGAKVTPTIIASVQHSGEAKIPLKSAIGNQVISRNTADSVTSVLTGVVSSGTGSAARQASQVAGKTGTSDSDISAWFTGYTPTLVTSVGMFGEQAKTDSQHHVGDHVALTGTGAAADVRVNGGTYPAQVWSAYTRAALADQTPQKFDLDTDQGDAVAPPPSATPSTSPTPSTSATPSTPPTAPTTSAPATPTAPPTSPTAPPTGGQPSTPATPSLQPDSGAPDLKTPKSR